MDGNQPRQSIQSISTNESQTSFNDTENGWTSLDIKIHQSGESTATGIVNECSPNAEDYEEKSIILSQCLCCLSPQNAKDVDHILHILGEFFMLLFHYADIASDALSAYFFHLNRDSASQTMYILGVLFIVLPIPIQVVAVFYGNVNTRKEKCLDVCLTFFGLYPLYVTIFYRSHDRGKLKVYLKVVSVILQSMPQAMLQLYSLLLTYTYISRNLIIFYIFSITLSTISITWGSMNAFWKSVNKKLKQDRRYHELSFTATCIYLEGIWCCSSVIVRIITYCLIVFILRWWSVLYIAIEWIIRMFISFFSTSEFENGQLVWKLRNLGWGLVFCPHDPLCICMGGNDTLKNIRIGKYNSNSDASSHSAALYVKLHFISTITSLFSILVLHFKATAHADSLQNGNAYITVTVVLILAEIFKLISVTLWWYSGLYNYPYSLVKTGNQLIVNPNTSTEWSESKEEAEFTFQQYTDRSSYLSASMQSHVEAVSENDKFRLSKDGQLPDAYLSKVSGININDSTREDNTAASGNEPATTAASRRTSNGYAPSILRESELI